MYSDKEFRMLKQAISKIQNGEGPDAVTSEYLAELESFLASLEAMENHLTQIRQGNESLQRLAAAA